MRFDAAQLGALPVEGTVRQFADKLNVSVTTLRAWIKYEKMPHSTSGQWFMLHRDAFVAWLKSSGRYLHVAAPYEETTWIRATAQEVEFLKPYFSRLSRHRGILPTHVFVSHDNKGNVCLSAMRYCDAGKLERWGIQKHPSSPIVESWPTIAQWLRVLTGDYAAFEVYPRGLDVVDSAPVRWFWIFKDGLPAEADLK